MKQLRHLISKHWHAVAIVTVLTVAVTFPMILYVFRTDVFWLPTGESKDIFIGLWDIWYGKLVLTGNADRYFTDIIFYPQGVSLAGHPLFVPQIAAVVALTLFLPLSNVFNPLYLLFVIISQSKGRPKPPVGRQR